MAYFGYFPSKYDSEAVEDLLSQAKDLYVLEQVAAINCSGFTNSSLPTNLESRFLRLKSLPVSRPDPVKLLSHSKTMASSPCTFASDAKPKLLPKENLRMSSSSFTSVDLSSPSSEPNTEKTKSKWKFSSSWFGKLSSPGQAMGCLWISPSKSATNTKKSELYGSEEQRRKLKIAMKESKKRERKVDKLLRKSRALRASLF